jgi:intein/homing endonuclease
MTVHIVSEQKLIFNKDSRKLKSDYVLNIDKILKNKIGTCSVVLNQFQAWVLNYEISKLLKKVIVAGGEKYTDIYYVNKNLSSSAILNLSEFLAKNYDTISFEYVMHIKDKDPDMIEIFNSIKSNGLQIKKAAI